VLDARVVERHEHIRDAKAGSSGTERSVADAAHEV